MQTQELSALELNSCGWEMSALEHPEFNFLDELQFCEESGEQVPVLPALHLADAQGRRTAILAHNSGHFCNPTFLAREPPNSRADHARAVNRRAQRRYRERKKARWQQLETELAETKAALHHLQSRSVVANATKLQPPKPFATPTYLPLTCRRLTCHVPDVLDAKVTAQLKLLPWMSDSFLTDDLPPQQEAVCQKVASLSPQQLTGLWQGYINNIAKGLLEAGPEMGGPGSLPLESLLAEFCALHVVKARVAPREWRSLMNGMEGTVAQSQVDWGQLAHMLQFTDSQKMTAFKLRRKYNIDMAGCTARRQRLTQQVQAAPDSTCLDGAKLAASHDALDEVAQQLQACVAQEHLIFVGYMRALAHQVHSTWQGGVMAVHSFPQTPDVVAMVNALAEAAGEMSAAAIQATPVYDSVPISLECWHDETSLDRQCCPAVVPEQQQAQCSIVINEVTPDDIFG